MAVKNIYSSLQGQPYIVGMEETVIDEAPDINNHGMNDDEYALVTLSKEKPVKLTTTEHTPFLENKSPLLCNYIFNKFAIDSEVESIPCWKKIPEIGASSVAIVCGYVSWYPIILGVMNLGIDSREIKIILAGGGWISYGGLYAWGTLQIVQQLFKKRSPTEVDLIKDKIHPFLSIVYKGSVAVLGLGSTLPNAYFAYTFNKQNIVWTIVNSTGSWGINAYPIHNMIQEFYIPRWGFLRPFCSESFYEKAKWNEVREFLILRLRSVIEKIPESDVNKIVGFFERIDSDDSLVDTADKTKENAYTQAAFKKIFKNHKEALEHTELVGSFLQQKKVQYPVKILSALLPISNIYANATATLKLVSAFTDLTIVKAIIVPIALAPSYLTYSLNRDCLLFLIKQILNIKLARGFKTIPDIHYPKKRVFVVFTATFLSLLSSSIDYTTAREIYPGSTFIDWTATIASIINSLALTLLPMIELSTLLLDYGMSFFGKPEVKLKIDKSQRIEELIFFIRNCPQEDLADFVNILKMNKSIRKNLTVNFPWLGKAENEV